MTQKQKASFFDEIVQRLEITKTDGEVTADTVVRSVIATLSSKETELKELRASLEEIRTSNQPMWKRFTSRKFILALLGLLIPILNQIYQWNLDVNEIGTALVGVLAFIGIEGWTDHQVRMSAQESSKKTDVTGGAQ